MDPTAAGDKAAIWLTLYDEYTEVTTRVRFPATFKWLD
jgi:hypothetical protein